MVAVTDLEATDQKPPCPKACVVYDIDDLSLLKITWLKFGSAQPSSSLLKNRKQIDCNGGN